MKVRKQIAFVNQVPAIFDTDILDNLCYPNLKPTEKQIGESLKLTNLDDFVGSVPDGLKTLVGEDGSRLSVGQRQRIAISRAFLSKTPIIILDEPTSALDSESERIVKNSIDLMVRKYHKTVIMIAHRLSTIEDADLVLELSKGKLSSKLSKSKN